MVGGGLQILTVRGLEKNYWLDPITIDVHNLSYNETSCGFIKGAYSKVTARG
jgi:hypothetical protein